MDMASRYHCWSSRGLPVCEDGRITRRPGGGRCPGHVEETSAAIALVMIAVAVLVRYSRTGAPTDFGRKVVQASGHGSTGVGGCSRSACADAVAVERSATFSSGSSVIGSFGS